MPASHYDAVIVGSGFGGSVTAYRLAEAGLNVCLLERGKAYPPGSFPRSPRELRRAFWDPSEDTYGMFDVWSFDNFEALISSGLGGGSLIYANVLLRKDADWFVREEPGGNGYEYWPVTREDLDPHYERVEEMMNVQKYPIEEEPYSHTPKTNEFRRAARRLDLEWDRVPLAVTFGNEEERPVPGEPIREPEGNLHGRTRTTCRLCGECDIGCNYGSKNTLDYNYLSAAEREGADIRTLHEVRSFHPRSTGGFRIDYVVHEPEAAGSSTQTRPPETRRMTGDRLILSAGTLGSTYLMLKNRADLPGVSDRLGTRFCGNGDLLGFVLDAEEGDPQSGGYRPRVLDPDHGPVITSTIRGGDRLDGEGAEGRGFYLQDAGYPSFMSWLVESADIFSATRRYTRLLRRIVTARLKGDTNLSAEMQDLVGGALSSSSLPLLGMGRDVPDGRMSLENARRLTCDWELDESRDYFARVKQTMEAVAEELGATFAINPTWLLKRVITVHPLGGCPMGRHDGEGVVDEYGRVFNQPDLYVADGSIMPGPVGPNPSLTIAAVADRIADRIIEEERGPTGATAGTGTGASDSGDGDSDPAVDSTADETGESDAGLRTSDAPVREHARSRPSPSPLREEVVPFTAGDGYRCNLIHLQGETPGTKGPVLVVHGAGVRANIFRAPVPTNFAEYLVQEGYDVWLLNWRASIDLEPNEWTLDHAAVYDHPRAVQTVLERTGAESVQAVIHCQGSTSFALAAAAGLLPRVRTVVSNAVSLHPVVPRWSEIKLNYILPAVGKITPYLNPQWNEHTDHWTGRTFYRLTELTHHECENPVCRQVSFYYGSGFPALWSHDNLNTATHEWLREEFANVPISFYRQITDGVNAGHLVPTGRFDELPDDVMDRPPRTDARFAFFAGADNRCFLPESQVRTHTFFDEYRPGRDSLHVLPGYGHLDVFMGRDAHRDVYPLMVEQLDRDSP